MADARDLLVEIGTEELPPRALLRLAKAFESGIVEGLDKARLEHGDSRCYATPRRLAVRVNAVAEVQPEQRMERRGPALKAAFDDAGRPTRAAEGFARSCGVSVAQLTTLETDKGSWLAHVHLQPGQPAIETLPGIMETALNTLPVPKRMRWGRGDAEFSRPVRWIVLLFGGQSVPARFFDLEAGRVTHGHRFHHPELIVLDDPAVYVERLREPGRVMADFDERRSAIVEQVEVLAAEAGGRAVIDPELLEEVTALVEWPVALLGHFERRFLRVPQEALISTMQDNQRYFPVVDDSGGLLPCFITVANLDSRDPDQVRTGNERVIRPRFSDAEFFWEQDRRRPLECRRESLKTVVFQQRLGTLHDKSRRVMALAGTIADTLGEPAATARRAAELAKCDLLTDMVQEFPELQGIMGRYYALHDNEPMDVAWALEEQYRPRFAGDDIPQTATGRILALAERLDTLLGIFAIGQPPTGASDPFALRRAALGVIRIMVEGDLDLDLERLLRQAADGYVDSEVDASAAVEPVFGFIVERMRGYYLDHGFRTDVFEAVHASRPTRPLDFDRRLRAVTAFGELPEAVSLSAADKRIRNILRQADGAALPPLSVALMQEPAERSLAEALAGLDGPVRALMQSGDYSAALRRLSTLHGPVDRFFDEVMVMTEDPSVRGNRLALLHSLGELFSQVADLSRLQD